MEEVDDDVGATLSVRKDGAVQVKKRAQDNHSPEGAAPKRQVSLDRLFRSHSEASATPVDTPSTLLDTLGHTTSLDELAALCAWD